jgi:hypothetical protein
MKDKKAKQARYWWLTSVILASSGGRDSSSKIVNKIKGWQSGLSGRILV